MRILPRMVACLAVAAFVSAQALGCNTIRGMGKDVERGGEAIQDAAE